MAKWEVFKYVRSNGRCPIDKWYGSRQLTMRDRAALDARIDRIEGTEGKLPPEWVKLYKTSTVHEMKAKGDNYLRPLCTVIDSRKIVLLIGIVKKSKNLPKRDVDTAERLQEDMEKGYGSIKQYHED